MKFKPIRFTMLCSNENNLFFRNKLEEKALGG